MLRHALGFLLILGLALPAIGAVPAAGAVMTSHAGHAVVTHLGHHHTAADEHAAPDRTADSEDKVLRHDCIGCIASYATLPAAPERLAVRGMSPRGLPLRQLSGSPLKPEVPPPRSV